MQQLRWHDEVAAQYGVRHILPKEEYLNIQWDARGKASSEVLPDRHYGEAARQAVGQGLTVPAGQVYQGASGMQARGAVPFAVEMWGVAFGPGSAVWDIALCTKKKWPCRWRWGGTTATRFRALLLALEDVLRPRELVAVEGDQQSASSQEEDEGQAGSSSPSALGSEEWESDQEVTHRKAGRLGLPLRLWILHVWVCAWKRAEVEATMRRRRLDVLGETETHSHRQGWQFAPSYTALESGAVDVEGKVVRVPQS